MQKISNDGATASAKAFVVLPLAVVLIIFALTIADARAGRGSILEPAVTFLGGVLVVLAWKFFIWPLADEVSEADNSLKIRKGKTVGIFELSSINRIEEKLFSRPAKATIIFLENGMFGWKIDFIPLGSGSAVPLRSDFLKDLNKRIERSKGDVQNSNE